ncbi:MAG: hypothetical protein QXL67_03015 [Candidatus Bathyarchaeia archaeon]
MEQALSASDLGRPLKEVVDFFELMRVQKDAGLVINFSDLLDFLISMLYSREENTLHKRWYEAGVWYGTYLQVKIRDEKPLEALKRILSEGWWELNEVDLSVELDIFTLRCISFSLSLERTKLFMSFLEGVISSLGYEVVKKDCIRGIIILSFVEGGSRDLS